MQGPIPSVTIYFGKLSFKESFFPQKTQVGGMYYNIEN